MLRRYFRTRLIQPVATNARRGRCHSGKRRARPPLTPSLRRVSTKGCDPMATRALSTRVAAVRVVGIGASAGGLDAFIDLISPIPAGTGLAFVLIQHLDPHHDSLLVDILAGATKMPVHEVVDGMAIERDHVYVIPPDTGMTVEGNLLRIVPRTAAVPHRP